MFRDRHRAEHAGFGGRQLVRIGELVVVLGVAGRQGDRFLEVLHRILGLAAGEGIAAELPERLRIAIHRRLSHDSERQRDKDHDGGDGSHRRTDENGWDEVPLAYRGENILNSALVFL